MPFEQFTPKIPDDLFSLDVRFKRVKQRDVEGNFVDEYVTRFYIELMDQDGNVLAWRPSGDLEEHLTPEEKLQQKQLLDAIWDRAKDQIIGS